MKPPHPRNVAMGEGFKAVAESLNKESDRGTVVLAAAWLDVSLTKIIAKFLRPLTQSKENLLKAGQPIGDFGTKIILANRLSLITPNLTSSLTLCRKLRNDFAHLSSDLSFETPHVKDRVNELFNLNEDLIIAMGKSLISAGLIAGIDGSTKITADHMMEAFGPKRLFQFTCGFINTGLAIIEFDISPCQSQFKGDSNNKTATA